MARGKWSQYSTVYNNSLILHNNISVAGDSAVKNPLETQIQSLGWEDPTEKEMATHSSVLASEIPWTKESSRQKSMGSGRKRIRHDLVTKQQQYQLLFWCFFSCFFDAVA